MWRWPFLMIALVGLTVLAACAGEEEATPAPTTPGAAGKPAWEQEWGRVLAAAKQEGKVAVVSDVGPTVREALTQPFQKRYGITVEHLGISGGEAAARLKTERAAGQYLWDVMVHGTTTMITDLIPSGIAEPIKPALILPEVTDTKNWRDGRLEFADKAGVYDLVFIGTPKVILAYNKSLVDPKELKSYKDLLAPKWKGKMAAIDPRVAGPGLATFTFFYMNQELGESFIRELAGQDLQLTRDHRQIAESVAQGKVLLAVGTSESQTTPLIEQGLPIGMIQALKEGGYITAGNGSVILINKAPHPNAAKVYINWLLSNEGQTAYVGATGYLSRRLDVPQEIVAEHSRMQPGVIYDTENYKEDVVKRKDEVAQVLQKYFK